MFCCPEPPIPVRFPAKSSLLGEDEPQLSNTGFDSIVQWQIGFGHFEAFG